MKEKTKQKIIVGLACLALGLGGPQFGKNVLRQGEWERSRREVQMEIDFDGNRVFTNKEWAPVYRELGLESTKQYGIDLSTEQFKQYLGSRS